MYPTKNEKKIFKRAFEFWPDWFPDDRKKKYYYDIIDNWIDHCLDGKKKSRKDRRMFRLLSTKCTHLRIERAITRNLLVPSRLKTKICLTSLEVISEIGKYHKELADNLCPYRLSAEMKRSGAHYNGRVRHTKTKFYFKKLRIKNLERIN